MHNHDILIRLRYALDIKNKDMVEIFKLGDIEVTREEVMQMLTKPKDDYYDEYDDGMDEDEDGVNCNNMMLESFLNGLIIFKRGRQEPKPGQPQSQAPDVKIKESVNNILLKKLKIALTLTSEDMIDILDEAGVMITKGELSAILRKVGHRNYKECGDRYARNFLKGLTLRYRVRVQ
ncbi:DUF1456 family protein [Bacillus sp. AFS017274]|uniref:DUF1456 family protein n=1 Tax=Bacillaceae TaxID=186817 RepID=UPI000BF29A90|nr:DUF1456 family protein [Bacillus sp. AFS017274]PEZ82447.1 cytoplasmic protein [Bacillus sp. AFS017274]